MKLQTDSLIFPSGRIDIKTTLADNPEIVSDKNFFKSAHKDVQSLVIESQDRAIISSLVHLGWTPPADSANLKLTPEVLENNSWYPVEDRHGNQECAIWDIESQMFIDLDSHSVCSLASAVWIGPKINFPKGTEE